ncbi:MAG: hypothetical protein ACJ735_00830 [Actinomycetes bacterium]
MAPDRTGNLIIDCDDCSVRGRACDDCVVTVLLAGAADAEMGSGLAADLTDADAAYLALAPEEAQALDALAAGGLLPPLRLTPRTGTG